MAAETKAPKAVRRARLEASGRSSGLSASGPHLFEKPRQVAEHERDAYVGSQPGVVVPHLGRGQEQSDAHRPVEDRRHPDGAGGPQWRAGQQGTNGQDDEEVGETEGEITRAGEQEGERGGAHEDQHAGQQFHRYRSPRLPADVRHPPGQQHHGQEGADDRGREGGDHTQHQTARQRQRSFACAAGRSDDGRWLSRAPSRGPTLRRPASATARSPPQRPSRRRSTSSRRAASRTRAPPTGRSNTPSPPLIPRPRATGRGGRRRTGTRGCN